MYPVGKQSAQRDMDGKVDPFFSPYKSDENIQYYCPNTSFYGYILPWLSQSKNRKKTEKKQTNKELEK